MFQASKKKHAASASSGARKSKRKAKTPPLPGREAKKTRKKAKVCAAATHAMDLVSILASPPTHVSARMHAARVVSCNKQSTGLVMTIIAHSGLGSLCCTQSPQI